MDYQRPDLARRRKLRRLVYAAVVCLTVIAAAVAVSTLETAAPRIDRTTIWTGTVERGEFVREVRGPGRLAPREIRWIPAASPGRIDRILVRPGTVVDADAVLMVLSNPDLVEDAEEARWAIVSAEASLAALEADLDRSLLDAEAGVMGLEADLESARLQADAEAELARRAIVSTIQAAQSAMRVSQLQKRLDFERRRLLRLQSANEARRQSEQALLDQARRHHQRLVRQVEDLAVRAGMSGVVQEISVQEGEQLAAGVNVARIARPDELIAELRIPETRAREILLGQIVRVDTRSGVIDGSVMRIDPAVRDGAVLVDVALNGQLPPGARPDLSVDGLIELERVGDALHLARPAHGQAESTTRLFRIDADGHARQIPVTLGRASVNRIEVREGLRVGDEIILSDTARFDQHPTIRLTD
ncbi:MAG: efflux RND transporter periplasmic adaptor subunit [Wenzhouxiangella sp.]